MFAFHPDPTVASNEQTRDGTRREQRAAARRERVAAERAARARAARRRRFFQLGGVVAIAAVIVVVVIVASGGGGGGGPSGLQSGTTANKTVAQVSSLLRGVPQSGVTLGNPRAPVTMTYYGDLQCPICRTFTLNTMPQLIAHDVRDGTMNIQYRALETATQDPTVFQQQQVAALSAGQQNRMWDYVELFYHQQGPEGSGYVNNDFLRTLASQARLDMARWQSGLSDAALARQVQAEGTRAAALGVSATPTLILRGPRGTRGVAGAATYAQMQQLLASVSA
ncbi:MAG TPA: thioredoxin domain-containing protein [Conexibacter sp.]|jgi:protein-disulfide isomerase